MSDESLISDEMVDKITPWILGGLGLFIILMLIVCLFIQAKQNKTVPNIPNVTESAFPLQTSVEQNNKPLNIVYFGSVENKSIGINKVESFKNPENIKYYKLNTQHKIQEKDFIDFLFKIHNQKNINVRYWKNYFSNTQHVKTHIWKGKEAETGQLWELVNPIKHLDSTLLYHFFNTLQEKGVTNLTYNDWNQKYKKLYIFKPEIQDDCSTKSVRDFYAKLYPDEKWGHFPEQDDNILYSNIKTNSLSTDRKRFDKYGNVIDKKLVTINEIAKPYETSYQPINLKKYKPLLLRRSLPLSFNCQRPWLQCHSRSFLQYQPY